MSRGLQILDIRDGKEVLEHSQSLLQGYGVSVRLVIVLDFPVVYFGLFLNVVSDKLRGYYDFLSIDFFVWKHLLELMQIFATFI